MIKATIISLLIAWLPIEDMHIKMQIGILLSALLDSRDLRKNLSLIFHWFRKKHIKKQQITIPDHTKECDFNPLFDKMQFYLSTKYSKMLESCELVPKNGDIEFNIKDMIGCVFTDTYNNHVLNISIQKTTETETKNKYDSRQISILSDTATSEDIRNYVRKIISIQIKNTNTIKIYRPIVRGKKKTERTVEWEQIIAKTNKTLENTIYSESFQKEMFDDLDMFMNNESVYSKKGIPYKRGYFLHSTPGQGKTSVAKIVANKYGTPVFCLDLTTIDDNATLVKLMTELNYHTHDNKYILLIEDAERSDFFDHRYRDPKLSMDCFLNVIDGVVEPHGRIIIMTANDPRLILENKALMRAGRIDKTIELKPCDKYQIKKMYELFFGDLEIDTIKPRSDDLEINTIKPRSDNLEIDIIKPRTNNFTVNWDEWEFNETLSAAYIMKLLQENANNPKVFIHMIGQAKTGDDKDIKLDDTFKNIIANAKEEQSNDINDINDRNGRRRCRSRKSRNRPKSNKIEDVVKFTQTKINRNARQTKTLTNTKNKLESKLPILLDKLKVKKEKALVKKLREKAIKRAEYLRKQMLIEKFEEKTNEYEEEEYETPAFLLNSIDESIIPDGTITTYENIEVPDELSIDMVSKAESFQPTVYDPVTQEQIPIKKNKVLSLRPSTPIKPAKSSEPAKRSTSTVPNTSSEPTTPTESTESTESANHSEPTTPTEPTESTEPTTPSESARRINKQYYDLSNE